MAVVLQSGHFLLTARLLELTRAITECLRLACQRGEQLRLEVVVLPQISNHSFRLVGLLLAQVLVNGALLEDSLRHLDHLLAELEVFDLDRLVQLQQLRTIFLTWHLDDQEMALG